MFALLNKVKYTIPEEDIADKIMKAKIKPIYTEYIFSKKCMKYDGTLQYSQIANELAKDTNRNELILEYLRKNKEHYCLVLSDRLEGLEYLHNKIGGVFINGKMTSKKEKEKRQQAIKDIKSGKEHILFASFGIAREGLNIPNLDRLFLVAPTKNEASVVQSVGRIERTCENKTECIVYDFIDIKNIYYEKMWKNRKRIYKKNGNEILLT